MDTAVLSPGTVVQHALAYDERAQQFTVWGSVAQRATHFQLANIELVWTWMAGRILDKTHNMHLQLIVDGNML